MFQASRALFLYCTSPVHMGAGAAIGTIDNPVQRERHTGHPMLAGSGLKGALRHHLQSDGWSQVLDDGYTTPLLERVFGPEAASDRLHAGALSLADAQIVLFPVRSLRHSFVYLTCPTALGRLLRLLEFSDGEKPAWDLGPLAELQRDQCASHNQDLHEEGSPRVVLESFEFQVSSKLSKLSSQIGAWLGARAVDPRPSLAYFRKKLTDDLVIVHDDRFSYFVQAATIVEPHVRIDDATGTASDGGLFYTENVPPESLFLSVTMASRERRPTPKPTPPPVPKPPRARAPSRHRRPPRTAPRRRSTPTASSISWSMETPTSTASSTSSSRSAAMPRSVVVRCSCASSGRRTRPPTRSTAITRRVGEMSGQSLDHGRASFAWERVVHHADAEYATLAKSAPAMVMANGLLQSLAFLRSKAPRSNAHRNLCDDVLRWFGQPGSPWRSPQGTRTRTTRLATTTSPASSSQRPPTPTSARPRRPWRSSSGCDTSPPHTRSPRRRPRNRLRRRTTVPAAVPDYVAELVRGATDVPPGHQHRLYFAAWNGQWDQAPNFDADVYGRYLDRLTTNRAWSDAARALTNRQAGLAETVPRVLSRVATARSPLVTGVGIEHPSENGFAFYDPHGVPFLPGSSVKGVLRRAAEELALWSDAPWDLAHVWWWFGFEAGSIYLSRHDEDSGRPRWLQPGASATRPGLPIRTCRFSHPCSREPSRGATARLALAPEQVSPRRAPAIRRSSSDQLPRAPLLLGRVRTATVGARRSPSRRRHVGALPRLLPGHKQDPQQRPG